MLGKAYGAESGEGLSFLSRKFFFINLVFKNVLPILLFYSFTTRRIPVYVKIMLLFACIAPGFNSVMSGSRFVIITDLIYMIAVYLFFKPYFKTKINKRVQFAGLYIFILFFIFTAAITLFRFQNSTGESSLSEWIFLYTSESFVNFSGDMWGINQYSNGDNSMHFFRDFFDISRVTDRDSFQSLYESLIKIRLNVYYTFIGDFYVDFGFFGTIFLIICLSFVFYQFSFTRNNLVLDIDGFFILSIWIKVCLVGFMYYTYINWPYQIWGNILMYLFCKFYNSNRILIKKN